MRKNPYSQVDDEGFLINPSSSRYRPSTEWYHFSSNDFDVFRPLKGREVTFFGGDYSEFEETIIPWRSLDGGVEYTVRIKPLKGALILTRDDVFEPVPREIHRELNEFLIETMLDVEDQFCAADVLTLQDNSPEVHQHFSTFACVQSGLRELMISENKGVSEDHICAYLISLYCMAYRAVQSLFWSATYSFEHFGVHIDVSAHLNRLGFHGWFEREKLALGHGLNIGLDLRHFEVEIIEKARQNPAVYHGGDVDVQALDPVWMAHDEANQQEGVGIYFTTNIETAKRYGPKVIEAYIDLDEFVPSREYVEDYFTREQIAELIYEIGRKSSTEAMYYFITNWFDFPVNTRIDLDTAYVLAGNYMDTQIRHFQNELVEIDKEAFIEAWNETLGVKGTCHQVTDDEVWVAIIDPEVTVEQRPNPSRDRFETQSLQNEDRHMRSNPRPRPWLPEVEGEYVYHVTHRSNLPSIHKYGLAPKVPEDMDDTKAVYVFPSEDDMQTALGQWFGERIEDLIEEGIYTDDWVCLGIMLEGINWDDCISVVGYEIAILHTVEPQYIRVLDIPV